MVCLSDERMVEERVRALWSTSSETVDTADLTHECLIQKTTVYLRQTLLNLPEISSSSSSDCKLLLFSQVGGAYFFLVTYCRPIVLLALFTRFLESVLKIS